MFQWLYRNYILVSGFFLLIAVNFQFLLNVSTMSELESCFWMLLGKSLELNRGHSIGPIFRIF